MLCNLVEYNLKLSGNIEARLFSRFSDPCECERIYYAIDAYTFFEPFKNRITEKPKTYETKGGAVNLNSENNLRFLIFSNNINCVEVQEDERRFYFIECKPNYHKNLEFFTESREWMKERKNRIALFNYFNALDVTDFTGLTYKYIRKEQDQ